MPELRRIYIAGPMTGRPEHNFPAFHAAAKRLQEAGWEVVNPADNFGGRTDLPRSSYLRADVALLLQCDALALLPDWQQSLGAKLEYLLACELEMTILDAETLAPLAAAVSGGACSGGPSSGGPVASVQLQHLQLVDSTPVESVLDEAERLTSGRRNQDYGHPADDFARTAAMWTGILSGKLADGCAIDAMDVPLCMIAVKVARQAHQHKRDNLVDIAGYARTAAMVAGEE